MRTLSPQWRMVNVRLYNNATANGMLYRYQYDEQVRRPDGSWRDGEWNSGGSLAVVNGYTAVGAFTRHCPRGGRLETRRSGLSTTYVCVGGFAAVGHTPPAIPAQQCAAQAGMRTPNPILPATGEKVFVREDIVDHAPHPLSLSLHYRTRWQLPPQSAMGAMWGHSHGANLRLDPTDGQGNTLILQHGDGSQVVFKRTSASGTWISPTHIANLQAFAATGSIPALRYTDPQNGTQWEFARPVGTGTGRLLLHRLENGWSYTYTYNAQGRLTQIQNHFGRTLRLAYHPNGLLAQLQGPDGHALRYLWDAQSRLQQVVYPGVVPAATSYLYENAQWPDHITAEVDERGQRRHSISYDAQGRATATVRPGNVDRYQVSYGNTTGPLNTTASITDPLGTVRQFGYAQTNGKTDVVSGSQLPGCQGETPIASRTQTAQGLLDTETDFLGNTTRYAWDDRLRMTRVTRAANSPEEQATTITWHSAFRKPTVIQEPLKRTNYTYDSLGRLTVQTVTHTAGAANGTQEITRYAYTDQRLVSAVTAPNGAVTHYTYDAAGLPATITNPLGHVTRLSHDAAGRPTRITEPTGLVRTLSYNERGWLVRSSALGEPGGPALETSYAYTPSGQVARITQPSGHVVSYSYDNAQRLIGWSDNRRHSARFTLDALGNRVQETVLNRGDGIALQVAREVNQINRLSREVLGSDQRSDYAYDANGRLRQGINAAGQRTALSRDAMARITSVTNALGKVARLGYDRGNAVSSVSDFKGVSTTYIRDAKGQAASEQSPDVGSTQNTFDALGLPQSVVDALGRATQIARDPLGRPTRITQSASGKPTLITELRYDLTGNACNATGHPSASLGRLCEMITREGEGEGEGEAERTTTRFQWDAFGRLRQQGQNISSAIADHSQTRNVNFSHVPSGAGAGELASVTYPSGAVLSYQYDSTGVLTDMRWNGQPLLQGITYNALGQPLSWTWRFAHASASLLASRSYNPAGQLISSETGTYSWNNLGQLASFGQTLQRSNGSGGWVAENVPYSVSYNASGRLLQLRGRGSVPALQSRQTYAYDANGNRKDPGLLPDAKSNRLRQARSQPVVSNAAGEITWQTGQSLRYDAGGRLHQIKACASRSDSACASSEVGATRHWYNGQHQRVVKDEPSGQTIYVYGTAGHNVLGEYRQSSTASTVQSTEHIYLPTASGLMPVAAVINGQHYAVHSDHLNTPRRLTDSAQRVRWQWAYSGYGETQAQPLATGSLAAVPYNLRYPGQVDDGNGLFYNWHRFYHPASGRYVSADPIGLEGGWNRFAYVGGNPLSYTDPEGLNPLRGFFLQLLLLNQRYGPTAAVAMADLGGVNGTLSTSWPGLTALPRALTAADLGLEGALTACKGSIAYDGKTVLMNVDYIEGSIKNGREVLNKLIDKATHAGAQELRIQATIANEGFYATLPRFGFTHQQGVNGYADQFVRPILVNQIPR